MSREITVIVKRPGEKPELRLTSADWGALRALIGGYIEVVWATPNLAVFCDEDGLLKRLPPNGWLDSGRPHMFIGAILVVSHRSGNLDCSESVGDTELAWFSSHWHEAQRGAQHVGA